ncbi:c-type cytochrome domain-containing protein [Flammeovirga kamogawensis]|uniref:Cytochrome C Planctomycete-type domain-containing protein n=1 Tax=Flammeovirga kamogawensis TaxID=373891 RepID=A0ABX8GTH9_9BACT|nr:c-type cytochrome domain-containing protein [Flammeovirga kamogawensis]MBB6460055.1 putative membrane protein [Flammeovirga kamogawensis]QWG06898.1 hypothetical protein KM029_16550 [Flammeovirga kamogawensis]TRX68719.1 hypothetical protein EO216_11545 [Flammeovirga kamogawensis]
MENSNIILFFGRFHPLIVHLPIGFLVLAICFEIADRFQIIKGLKPAISFALLIGTLSAVVATIIGFMLATSGDYNVEMLTTHKWAGIATTVISGAAYFISAGYLKAPNYKVYGSVLFAIIVGLSITGHMGGNMTHGSDYLTYYMPFKPKVVDPLARQELTSLENAQVFGDLVHPIINTKCKSCHNDEKRKGKLSFSSIESYLKGGKNGNLLVAGHPLKSDLFHRVTLDEHDDDVMPPKGKTPLTAHEITILKFWIATANTSFDTLLSDMEVTEEVLNAAQNVSGLSKVKKIKLANIDQKVIDSLRNYGFEIRELVAGTNAFDVSLQLSSTNQKPINSYLKELAVLKNNILWLSLENCGLTDANLSALSNYSQLKKLKLSKNAIGDTGIEYLKNLQQLESLNLYQTNITKVGLSKLSMFPKLKRLYIWGTPIEKKDVVLVAAEHENLKILGI